MRFRYYKETDSLYIELSDRVGTDAKEAAPGVILDFDERGGLVGIDIDQAGRIANLSWLEGERQPLPARAPIP